MERIAPSVRPDAKNIFAEAIGAENKHTFGVFRKTCYDGVIAVLKHRKYN